MKKLFLMGFVALGFASCVSDKEVSTQTQDQKYQAAFENLVGGKINANVNWGFNDMEVNVIKNEEAESANVSRRAHHVNRNQWGTSSCAVNVPVNVTPNERKLVYDYFNVKREGAVNQNNVIWTDYFISEVWKGTSTSKDGNGDDVLGSDKMNHLQVLKGEGSINSEGALVGNWEHANDFNNGNHNSSFGTIEGHTFMYNSGTYDFAYHNTVDSKYHNEYIIIPGSEIDPSLAGYYYVGFDFYATHPTGQESNKNMDVERDWFFTDWIVRISPAEYMDTKRVFVEDLIANNLSEVDKSDWDFNDAVYDIAFTREYDNDTQNNYDYAVITLWAAGGTKALTIGGREVHELFGQSVSTMINTNANGGVDGLAPVQFRINLGVADYTATRNALDIETKVGSQILNAKIGEAPQMVVVSPSTKWMKERQIITSGYASFATYATQNTPETWYETVTSKSVLY